MNNYLHVIIGLSEAAEKNVKNILRKWAIKGEDPISVLYE